jgi:hypothetical protein
VSTDDDRRPAAPGVRPEAGACLGRFTVRRVAIIAHDGDRWLAARRYHLSAIRVTVKT